MNKCSGVMTKKRILDVASRIFSDYSYAEANMRMITSAANSSIGYLYLYFKNNEEEYPRFSHFFWVVPYSLALRVVGNDDIHPLPHPPPPKRGCTIAYDLNGEGYGAV